MEPRRKTDTSRGLSPARETQEESAQDTQNGVAKAERVRRQRQGEHTLKGLEGLLCHIQELTGTQKGVPQEHGQTSLLYPLPAAWEGWTRGPS